jgi:hypothetical protein
MRSCFQVGYEKFLPFQSDSVESQRQERHYNHFALQQIFLTFAVDKASTKSVHDDRVFKIESKIYKTQLIVILVAFNKFWLCHV